MKLSSFSGAGPSLVELIRDFIESSIVVVKKLKSDKIDKENSRIAIMLIKILYRSKQKALKKLEELRFIAENCRRLITGKEPLVDKRKEFWMKCGIIFPPLYPNPKPIPRNAYERLFIYGTRLGMYVSIVVQLILGLMIPFPSIRAVILIATVKLITSRLRSIILMFIIVWAFQIPATNTTRNLQMLAESVACVSDSAIQIGNKLVSEVNMQSNKLSLAGLKEQGRFFAKHLKNFWNTMCKLQNIIVKFGKQTKDYLMQLLTVKEYCQRFFIGPYYFVRFCNCLRIFDESAQYCDQLTLYRGLSTCKFVKDMRMVFLSYSPPFFTINLSNEEYICDRRNLLHSTTSYILHHVNLRSGLKYDGKPRDFDLNRLICDTARFGELVCDIPEKIKESLKSGFLTFTKDKMKATVNTVMGDYNISFLVKEAKAAKNSWDELGISLNHTIESNRTQMFQLEKMKEELEKVLNRFKVFVDILATTIKFIIPNMIIITLLMALMYVVKYKQKEKADNVYITEEFRNIDMIREAQGQPSLLPLLPKERQFYIEGFTLHMTSKEKMKMLFSFAITLIGGFMPTFLILLDVFTYQMLYFTYLFLQSNATRTDRLDFYNLKAAGEGFVAKLLQRILQIFHPITGSQHSDDDWRRCFTEPNPPDFQLIRLMMLLYFIALLLCVVQVYVVRCRHLIAQYYWPERTKPRTLWLYNQVLEGRKNILTQLINAAKEKGLKDQLVEDEISGRGNLVNRGLTILDADQYRCTRCFRPDLSVTDASNSRICPNCNSLYCTDCYAVKKKCLECGASLQAVLNDTDFYIDSSCDEDEPDVETPGTLRY
uniref:DC_STAMP domain-containing protein n=1 Tax=Elaeophora elaphi TaxID=1147741 RepID=A0A0R3RFC4_9BILA